MFSFSFYTTLQDYTQFHAPRRIFFDDNQTFSPQYDCKQTYLLISRIRRWTFANAPIRF